MRRFLLALVCLEGVALAALAGALLLYPERFERRAPPAPEFRPRILSAEGGEQVRYRLEDLKSGALRGYLEYRVERVEDLSKQGLGRVLHIRLTERDASGAIDRERLILFKPRLHGFLPPTLDDDGLPVGDLPVVALLESREFEVRRARRRGVYVEGVRPRWIGRGAAAEERFWFAPGVPVFGLARRERDGVAWALH